MFKKILITYLLLGLISGSVVSGWTEQDPGGIYQHLNSVSTVNQNTGWACGNFGVVLRTTNGGVNWINVGFNPPVDSLSLFIVNAFNENTAIVVCNYVPGMRVSLYRTTNAGQNWIMVFRLDDGYIDGLGFKDSSNGFMVGDPRNGRWSLWKSTNSGLNWDSTGLFLQDGGNETGYDQSMEVEENKIYFGTANYKIYYSTDFGINWHSSIVNLHGIFTISVSDLYGIAAGPFSGLRTTNGGINWFDKFLPGQDIGIFSSSHVDCYFWYTVEGGIFYSPDTGNNFSLQYNGPDPYIQIHLKKDINVISGWAVTEHAHISRYIEPIGIKPISSELPKKFELFQNYPNPFNPSTLINYQIPVSINVKLVIYDVLGREVATLVNEKQQPGKYQVTFDASNYASGVYFYKLVVSGAEPQSQSYTQIRKMVIIK